VEPEREQGQLVASSHCRHLLAVVCLRVHAWQLLDRRRGGGAGGSELWSSAACVATVATVAAAVVAAAVTAAQPAVPAAPAVATAENDL